MSRKRVLDPIDRVSEVLFGLIMVLTFTSSLSAATAGHTEVRTMLVAALGCNLAWGVIDALFYLLGCLVEKGHALAALRAVRAADAEHARGVIAGALPPLVAEALGSAELESLRQKLVTRDAPPPFPTLEKEEWLGALGVCALVFASTFPVVIPFVFMTNLVRALRVSNAIALTMLFGSGYVVGRMTGYHRWGTGLVIVLLGGAVVSMTIALGG